MANPEHVNLVRELTSRIQTWRSKHPETQLDLREASLQDVEFPYADLHGADLTSSDISFANLEQANLEEALLRQANLFGAKLKGANLKKTDLFGADLRGADLREADLSGANLIGAALTGAKLKGTQLQGAMMGFTALGDLNLSETLGLDTLTHYGPSILGIDTLCQSKGMIPVKFLVGVGLPEKSIQPVMSTLSKQPSFQTCYIMHTQENEALASRLETDLGRLGLRCWKWNPDDLNTRLIAALDMAVDLYDKLIVLVDSSSLNSGDITREMEQALKKEKERNQSTLLIVQTSPINWDSWNSPYKEIILTRDIIQMPKDLSEEEYDENLSHLVKLLANKKAE
jgi:hypothetical protein